MAYANNTRLNVTHDEITFALQLEDDNTVRFTVFSLPI